MINVSEETKLAWTSDSVTKSVTLYVPELNITLSNSDIVGESLTIEQSIQSTTYLDFIGCAAAKLTLNIVALTQNLLGKKILVTVKAGNTDTIPVFYGYVSEQTNANYEDITTTITAYDIMANINDADVVDWYNNLTFPTTVKQLRTSLASYLGIEEVTTTLDLDSMSVEKTVEVDTLSANSVLSSICAINGVFARVNGEGKLVYVKLAPITKGVYPKNDLYPDDELYPADDFNNTIIDKSLYSSANYEIYAIKPIDGVQIRQEENDIGAIVGECTNPYIIQDNFLVYGKNSTELSNIASVIFNAVKNLEYIQYDITARALPFVEPGDAIVFFTNKNIINSYVLSRTLSGIAGMTDNFVAEGDEYRPVEVNSLSSQITQLKGKTNTLTRTVDETKSEIRTVDGKFSSYSTITQTDSKIATAVQSVNTTTDNKLTKYSTITQTDSKIETAVSSVNQSTDKKLESYSTITQTDSKISTAVTSVNTTTDNKLKSYSTIEQTDSKISTKVSVGDVSSSITQESGEISISADRIAIDSTYFKLLKNGTITCTNASVSGAITLGIGDILYATKNNGQKQQCLYYYENSGAGLNYFYFPTQTDFADLRAAYVRVGGQGASDVYAYNIMKCESAASSGKKYVYDYIDAKYGSTDIKGNYIKAICFDKVIINNSANTARAPIGASAFNVESDIRLKDLEPNLINESISKDIILNLEPIAFTYKADEKKTHHRGFSAQQVKEVLDDIKLPKTIYEYDDEEDSYGIDKSELIPDLVNCIKDLYRQVEELKAKLPKE